MSIYKAITEIAGELSKTGVEKSQHNSHGRYNFRGIDDVYNALAPLLARHGVCIFPRVINRECSDRPKKDGGMMFFVTVEVEFDFVCALDGSKHIVKTFGEAMDTSDKATNKAMSAAYKYAMFQVFCIPTEGQDADAYTPPVDTSDAIETIGNAQSMEELQAAFSSAWKVYTGKAERDAITKAKDAAKSRLMNVVAES